MISLDKQPLKKLRDYLTCGSKVSTLVLEKLLSYLKKTYIHSPGLLYHHLLHPLDRNVVWKIHLAYQEW